MTDLEKLKIDLEKKIVKNPGTDCWGWISNAFQFKGKAIRYPQVYYKGRPILAHRASWIIHNGEIPEGLFVLHLCDNRICTNPKHLEIGNHQDNMQYKIIKNKKEINQEQKNLILRDILLGPKSNHGKRLNVEVDHLLHKEIKMRAGNYAITMKKYIMRAIIEQIKRDRDYE